MDSGHGKNFMVRHERLDLWLHIRRLSLLYFMLLCLVFEVNSQRDRQNTVLVNTFLGASDTFRLIENFGVNTLDDVTTPVGFIEIRGAAPDTTDTFSTAAVGL